MYTALNRHCNFTLRSCAAEIPLNNILLQTYVLYFLVVLTLTHKDFFPKQKPNYLSSQKTHYGKYWNMILLLKSIRLETGSHFVSNPSLPKLLGNPTTHAPILGNRLVIEHGGKTKTPLAAAPCHALFSEGLASSGKG